jgi:putative SOS response-associated peptidase YedK
MCGRYTITITEDKPFPVEQMRAYPVSKDVGNVKNQGKELVGEMEIK